MTETIERQSPAIPSATHPCLWMSAGLVSYKLCDRDFDCERCPLDAALRGEPRAALAAAGDGDGAGLSSSPFLFPGDRRYGAGHTWAQHRRTSDGGDGLARVGLDAFAAALAAPVHRLLPWASEGTLTAAGAPLGELELDAGTLPVASPVGGRLRAWNPAWQADTDAARLAALPYGDGWLAELILGDPAELDALAQADAAREGALLDLRRFRRRVALHLLAADAASPGPTLPDGGRVLTDLRSILGARRYLELLRELLG